MQSISGVTRVAVAMGVVMVVVGLLYSRVRTAKYVQPHVLVAVQNVHGLASERDVQQDLLAHVRVDVVGGAVVAVAYDDGSLARAVVGAVARSGSRKSRLNRASGCAKSR